jgi:hypothetical protein
MKIEVTKLEDIEMEDIQIEKVLKAYEGKKDKCMCGCSGNYYHTKSKQEEAGKERGYKVTDDEINDDKVAEIADIINIAPNSAMEVDTEVDDKYTYISATIGKKLYCVWVNK